MIKCVSCEKPTDESDIGITDRFNRVWCKACAAHVLATVQTAVNRQIKPIKNREMKPL
jgi:uncharacterized radical SAM superfamily protein